MMPHNWAMRMQIKNKMMCLRMEGTKQTLPLDFLACSFFFLLLFASYACGVYGCEKMGREWLVLAIRQTQK